MDNICHTLVGAACGAAGLNRRTRFGAATLMISANIPDVDVLVFATDTPWIEFRRGWTHGIVAQIVLPVAWTAAVWLFDRCRRSRGSTGDRAAFARPDSDSAKASARLAVAHARPERRQSAPQPFHAGWTLLLSLVGVYSHVFLDLLNNYGVRLASPISWRWFYGDAVFIVDPWMWMMLAVGIWLTGSQGRPRPARVALVAITCYAVAMLTSGTLARGIVTSSWKAAHGAEPRALMVGPLPLWPLSRQVIVDAGEHYETGVFSWSRAAVTFFPERIPKNSGAPEVAAARSDNDIRAFLVWARFPFWTVEPTPEGTRVTVSDMRFAGRNGFAASTLLPVGQ
jgi:inner membrane protein